MIQYRLRIGDTVKIPGLMVFESSVADDIPSASITARLRSSNGSIEYPLGVSRLSTNTRPDTSIEQIVELSATYNETSTWVHGSYDLTVTVDIGGERYTSNDVSVALFEE